jgi:CRISPR/Cas system-associated exonuclease Cas4 (RecB family)
MTKDKYTAVWVSHSSIGDYLKCPRAYYLKNIYRDPKTNHKIMLMSPPLALGQAVHEVVESLSTVAVTDRLGQSLLNRFEQSWKTISGESGGFSDKDGEGRFKERGARMITRIMDHPGPLLNKAIKIRQELPYYWLSEEDNIILCGKIDWLEFLEKTQSVHIIDFKTGKFDEDESSLQLPIYYLLVSHCQKWSVTKMSYWYLDRDDTPTEVKLPEEAEATERVLKIAKQIVLARKLEHFVCPKKDGCRDCRPYEAIISGRAKFVGVGGYSQDIYILQSK